jgi:hypothetical protein
MILRCVRTQTAPTPTVQVVPVDQISAGLPADTKRLTVGERTAVLEGRRRAVYDRFAR